MPQLGLYCPCGSVLPPHGSILYKVGMYWQRWVFTVSSGPAVVSRGSVTPQVFKLVCAVSKVGLFFLKLSCFVPGGFVRSPVGLYRLKWAFPVTGGSVLSQVGLNGIKLVYRCLELVCDVSNRSITSRVGLLS